MTYGLRCCLQSMESSKCSSVLCIGRTQALQKDLACSVRHRQGAPANLSDEFARGRNAYHLSDPDSVLPQTHTHTHTHFVLFLTIFAFRTFRRAVERGVLERHFRSPLHAAGGNPRAGGQGHVVRLQARFKACRQQLAASFACVRQHECLALYAKMQLFALSLATPFAQNCT